MARKWLETPRNLSPPPDRKALPAADLHGLRHERHAGPRGVAERQTAPGAARQGLGAWRRGGPTDVAELQGLAGATRRERAQGAGEGVAEHRDR